MKIGKLYIRPKLKDMSQGSRIAFIRQFRHLTQDNVSGMLGLTDECKRRTMTRYEKGNRHPKGERLNEIANILNTNVNLIKPYSFENSDDLIYVLLWLDELIPIYKLVLSDNPFSSISNELKEFMKEWNVKRIEKEQGVISYEDYLEGKGKYEKKIKN